jgi:hypothetical protein
MAAIDVVALWLTTQLLTYFLLTFPYNVYPWLSDDSVFYFPMMHASKFVLDVCVGPGVSGNEGRVTDQHDRRVSLKQFGRRVLALT